ncbi:hypothetical protein D3C72_961920 [compost metagenome]
MRGQHQQIALGVDGQLHLVDEAEGLLDEGGDRAVGRALQHAGDVLAHALVADFRQVDVAVGAEGVGLQLVDGGVELLGGAIRHQLEERRAIGEEAHGRVGAHHVEGAVGAALELLGGQGRGAVHQGALGEQGRGAGGGLDLEHAAVVEQVELARGGHHEVRRRTQAELGGVGALDGGLAFLAGVELALAVFHGIERGAVSAGGEVGGAVRAGGDHVVEERLAEAAESRLGARGQPKLHVGGAGQAVVEPAGGVGRHVADVLLAGGLEQHQAARRRVEAVGLGDDGRRDQAAQVELALGVAAELLGRLHDHVVGAREPAKLLERLPGGELDEGRGVAPLGVSEPDGSVPGGGHEVREAGRRGDGLQGLAIGAQSPQLAIGAALVDPEPARIVQGDAGHAAHAGVRRHLAVRDGGRAGKPRGRQALEALLGRDAPDDVEAVAGGVQVKRAVGGREHVLDGVEEDVRRHLAVAQIRLAGGDEQLLDLLHLGVEGGGLVAERLDGGDHLGGGERRRGGAAGCLEGGGGELAGLGLHRARQLLEGLHRVGLAFDELVQDVGGGERRDELDVDGALGAGVAGGDRPQAARLAHGHLDEHRLVGQPGLERVAALGVGGGGEWFTVGAFHGLPRRVDELDHGVLHGHLGQRQRAVAQAVVREDAAAVVAE